MKVLFLSIVVVVVKNRVERKGSGETQKLVLRTISSISRFRDFNFIEIEIEMNFKGISPTFSRGFHPISPISRNEMK